MLLLRRLLALAVLSFFVSCCGGGLDVCSVSPTQPATQDYRHAAKVVAIPAGGQSETTVAQMIGWGKPAAPGFEAPRAGRENQLFHISTAFVQSVWLQPTDADVHVEISDTADKNAPRVVVETPQEGIFCATRQHELALASNHGVRPSATRTEVAKPFQVSVTGLAFEDHPHAGRGSNMVATIWELHPAAVQ